MFERLDFVAQHCKRRLQGVGKIPQRVAIAFQLTAAVGNEQIEILGQSFELLGIAAGEILFRPRLDFGDLAGKLA